MTVAPLPYAAAPRRKRRIIRYLTIWLGLAVGIVASIKAAPAIKRKLDLLDQQRACLVYAEPEGKLVFDHELDALTRGEKSYVGPVGRAAAPAFLARYGAYVGPVSDKWDSPWCCAPIFMHERRRPDGVARLLVVQDTAGAVTSNQYYVCLSAHVIAPATLLKEPSIVAPASTSTSKSPFFLSRGHGYRTRPDGARVRFYAGQADPADASHFIIPYSVNDGRGTIDGWLRDADIVEMIARDGPAIIDR